MDHSETYHSLVRELANRQRYFNYNPSERDCLHKYWRALASSLRAVGLMRPHYSTERAIEIYRLEG